MEAKVLRLLLFFALASAQAGSAQTGAYSFTTVAGMVGTIGAVDGTNETSRFNFPGGIAFDTSGALYVADILNHTIRKVSPAGTNWVVTTIAGLAGTPGSTDGTNSDARFYNPNGVAVDRLGNLFVADHYNHTIRELTPSETNWIVTTIAGLAEVHGSADGTNSNARFWSPTGIAVDNNDHVFVTDTANFTVREIVQIGKNWVVSTIAGTALNFGFVDGTNGDAQFDFPFGISVDGAGRVYVADFGNNAIRQIVPSGTNWIVSTIAGVSGMLGSADGPSSLATFNQPNGICVEPTGALYVSDQGNDTIRKVTGSGKNWSVSTVGGMPLQFGSSDGLGNEARFKQPWGIAVGGDGGLCVADYGNQTIRRGLFIPALGIQLSSQKVVLEWPLEGAEYVVETRASLESSAVWSLLTNAPVTNGLNLIVVDQPTSSPVFYRLRKQ